MTKKLSYLGAILSLSLFVHADSSQSGSPSHRTTITSCQTTSIHPFTGKVKGNRVRLRLQPNLEGQVLRESRPGELFAITGEVGSFYSIRAPKDMKGYVFRPLVLEGTIEGDNVNIRQAPDMEANVIGLLQKGTKVAGVISPENNKWLEISLPDSVAFYVAKEYIEKAGDITLVNQHETNKQEALHRLNSALCFATAELKKAFEEIDPTALQEKFCTFISEFGSFSDLIEKAKEGKRLVEDAYVNKKIAFLESKNDQLVSALTTEEKRLQTIANELRCYLAHPLRSDAGAKNLSEFASLATGTFASGEVNDKMTAWEAIEQSCYHMWAAEHEGRSMDEYYADAMENATLLTGTIEPYDRPVKNRPGNFLLKSNSVPIAFLYSTKINLQAHIGKKVTVVSLPRPNNHFAFPAYFVVAVE